MKVLIAAGGTGGHIYPGITAAQRLLARDPKVDVLFVGNPDGLEAELVRKAGFPFAGVVARSLPRRVSVGALKTGWTAVKAVEQSLRIVRRFRPRVALGTGGYVSGPVMAAARLAGVPVVIQEQNAFPGLTSRMLGRLAHTVALGSGAAAKHFTKARRVVVTGNPIRHDIVARSRPDAYKRLGLDPRSFTLLVFGGSQGGASLNEAMLQAAPGLEASGVQVLWQTGPAGFPAVVESLGLAAERKAAGGPAGAAGRGRLHVLPFIDDMASAYAAADLVVCRAGAITLAEIAARGLPAVLVPYPFAAEGHQLANARAVEAAGAATVLLDADLSGAALSDAVQTLREDERARSRMAAASKNLGRPEAAEALVDLILAAAKSDSR